MTPHLIHIFTICSCYRVPQNVNQFILLDWIEEQDSWLFAFYIIICVRPETVSCLYISTSSCSLHSCVTLLRSCDMNRVLLKQQSQLEQETKNIYLFYVPIHINW